MEINKYTLIYYPIMKMRFLATIIAMGLSIYALAQQHPTSSTADKLQFVVGNEEAVNDTVDNPYDVLIDNIPTDPEYTAPHFAIIDRDQRFYLSLGASVKAVALYDWGNPYENPSDFKPSDFQPATQGDDQLLQMSIKSSSINLNIVGMPKNKYRIVLFIALMFNSGYGNEYVVKCDHAYIKCAGLTLGYTSSLYDDKSADAYLIDGNGAGASGGHSNMTFNWQRYITPNIKLGAGLELPKVSYTTFADVEDCYQRVPSIPLYAQYSWGDIGHVRLSSVIRPLRYNDAIGNCYRTEVGYGLKLTANARVGNFVSYLMAQTGRGIANYLKDNDGFNLDMTPSPDNMGQLNLTGSWGCLGAIQYNYTPKMFSTLMYGYMRNYVDAYNGGLIAYGDHMKYEHYAAVNFIWRASTFVDLGVEYNYGMKRNFADNSLTNNRISAMFRVSF